MSVTKPQNKNKKICSRY